MARKLKPINIDKLVRDALPFRFSLNIRYVIERDVSTERTVIRLFKDIGDTTVYSEQSFTDFQVASGGESLVTRMTEAALRHLFAEEAKFLAAGAARPDPLPEPDDIYPPWT